LPPSVEDPVSAAVGHGAGVANDFLIAERMGDVTTPVVPKVTYEYGLVGLLGILGVLVLLLGRGVLRRPWTAGLLLLYLYVNASFLQHTQVFITLFWICLIPADPRPDDDAEQPPERAARAGGHVGVPAKA
jgi:hypothetical protein